MVYGTSTCCAQCTCHRCFQALSVSGCQMHMMQEPDNRYTVKAANLLDGECQAAAMHAMQQESSMLSVRTTRNSHAA